MATGRVELITESYAKQLDVDLPCILYNGAAVYDFSIHTSSTPRRWTPPTCWP